MRRAIILIGTMRLHHLSSILGVSLRTTVVSAAVLGPLSANAAAPNAESADALADQLDEIIVTAEKRTERLQEVPLSVSSINATALLEQNKLSARNYLTQVPGVALDEVGAGQTSSRFAGLPPGMAPILWSVSPLTMCLSARASTPRSAAASCLSSILRNWIGSRFCEALRAPYMVPTPWAGC